jgi:hypothetical protein
MSPPSFPVGKHDDCVDALGLVGQLLDRMLLGAAARGVETAPTRQVREGVAGAIGQRQKDQLEGDVAMPFKPGQSGNPGGRPKVVGDVQALAREHTSEAIQTLATIMRSAKAPPAARTAAAAPSSIAATAGQHSPLRLRSTARASRTCPTRNCSRLPPAAMTTRNPQRSRTSVPKERGSGGNEREDRPSQSLHAHQFA